LKISAANKLGAFAPFRGYRLSSWFMNPEPTAIPLAYEETGAGAPVVLLHGYPLNRAMWQPQVAALRDAYRVVTPDLRGLGETEATPEPATMEDMARDVAALLDALEIERAIIGGLSMGGYVTLAFARLFPERVRALVLADTKATNDPPEILEMREQQAQLILEKGMAAMVEAFLPRLVAAETFARQPGIVKHLRGMMLSTKPAGAAAAQRGMAARRNQTDLLPTLHVPVLIIAGSEDILTPPSDSAAMRDALPAARLVVLEGAGHMANLESPAGFNQALREFLDET
jgi:pimeloyl-ACP methyl ester carboxylesterase